MVNWPAVDDGRADALVVARVIDNNLSNARLREELPVFKDRRLTVTDLKKTSGCLSTVSTGLPFVGNEASRLRKDFNRTRRLNDAS
jgi:hypothetical protein